MSRPEFRARRRRSGTGPACRAGSAVHLNRASRPPGSRRAPGGFTMPHGSRPASRSPDGERRPGNNTPTAAAPPHSDAAPTIHVGQCVGVPAEDRLPGADTRRRSPTRGGSGHWKYEVQPGWMRSLSGSACVGRWGTVGRMPDGLVLRPRNRWPTGGASTTGASGLTRVCTHAGSHPRAAGRGDCLPRERRHLAGSGAPGRTTPARRPRCGKAMRPQKRNRSFLAGGSKNGLAHSLSRVEATVGRSAGPVREQERAASLYRITSLTPEWLARDRIPPNRRTKVRAGHPGRCAG